VRVAALLEDRTVADALTTLCRFGFPEGVFVSAEAEGLGPSAEADWVGASAEAVGDAAAIAAPAPSAIASAVRWA
jgi:hypothetical protein